MGASESKEERKGQHHRIGHLNARRQRRANQVSQPLEPDAMGARRESARSLPLALQWLARLRRAVLEPYVIRATGGDSCA